MVALRFICKRTSCLSVKCPRHPTGQDENIPRIDLCGSSQCAMWAAEDDGDVTLHPPLKR